MTVIAAVVHEGRVYMGGDSLMSTGRGGLATLNAGKIWQESNGMLIGAAGTFRNAQVVRYSLNAPPLSEGQDIMAYLCTDFVNALRATHGRSGTLHAENGEEHSDVLLIIGWRGRLFSVSEWLNVAETPDGFMATGSGGDVALGVLSVTPDLPPTYRLTLAMQTAERFCEGVRGPFHILSTEVGGE